MCFLGFGWRGGVPCFAAEVSLVGFSVFSCTLVMRSLWGISSRYRSFPFPIVLCVVSRGFGFVLLVFYWFFTWILHGGVFCVGGLVQRVGAGQWGVWCGGVVVIQSGGGRGWSRDPVSGVEVMPEKWALFLDWLLDGEGRVPSTQKDWAELNGVAASTVRKWKRDPRFVREWDRRATDLNVHPERTQSVVESLWRAASGGDVKAASLYLQYVEKFTPKRAVLVDDGRSVAGLSDVELAAELEQLVAEVRGGSGG